ncbi:hypothetical protein BDP27DRAFT_1375122 [Rhodocollybia butyracea]|uniref:Uncharacterized protein n=1 Tax=Rhodocollybia butyracea TaxID=206335 RepID=A0A9P5TV57_9AGAR|nr:hypothetical protein BDP27DRAFT_1375122 [Rhodocollybia butyracea]
MMLLLPPLPAHFSLLATAVFIFVLALTLVLYFLSMEGARATDVTSTSPDSVNADFQPIKTVTIDKHKICIRRPTQLQPTGTLALPGRIEDHVYFLNYTNMYEASFPLPFPSLLIAPSETLNRPGLLDLCKTYALGVTGNMVALRAKLTGFSEDMVHGKATGAFVKAKLSNQPRTMLVQQQQQQRSSRSSSSR